MTFNKAPSPRELLIVYIYFILYIVSYKLYHSNPDIVLIILIYLLCNIKLCFSYLLLFIRYTTIRIFVQNVFTSGFLGSVHVPGVYALLAHAQRGGEASVSRPILGAKQKGCSRMLSVTLIRTGVIYGCVSWRRHAFQGRHT